MSRAVIDVIDRAYSHARQQLVLETGPRAVIDRAYNASVKFFLAGPISISMNTKLFGDYEKLLRVDVLGREIPMPERNTLLRGLQFASPETISYGRFCWNGACHNCTVTVRDGASESQGQACRLDASDGLCVTSVSSEIRRLL